jgi:GTP-binding protein
MTPIAVVVGRPNVGKSTLFNRLLGASLAIVDDQPGVTRDRHYGDAFLHGRRVTLVDTGGLVPDADDTIDQGIARHVVAAVEEADAVICVLDATVPVTEPDARVVTMLRKAGKPVLYVANKADGLKQEQLANDIYTLGVPGLICVSALHGRGIAELEAAISECLPETPEEPARERDESVTNVTIVGRPNAGKSSLFNLISGGERSLVSDIPGTTRDPVDATFEYARCIFHVVDTAGIRRRSHIEKTSVEAVSVIRAIRSMEKADVAVVLCDAQEGITEQDARLLGLCVDKGRGVVVGINKCDLVDRAERKALAEKCSSALHFAQWAPVLPISARTGAGVKELMLTAQRTGRQFHRRVTTGELNRFMEQVLAKHAPPTQGGRAPRIYYITQAATSPPTFVAMSNAPEYIKPSYTRYIANQIRKTFGFEGVPLNIRFRGRDKPERS